MMQQKKQQSAKVNTIVFSMRLPATLVKAIREQAEKETRNAGNMGKVLILEALKARGNSHV
jgi:hypothetical protein